MKIEQSYQIFQKTSKHADCVARIICFPGAVIFVVVILAQVFFRYVLHRPIEWYLEVVEISYMWALFMGISIAYKTGSHVQFIFLFNKLGTKIQRYLACACQFLALLFFVFMVIYGFKFFAFSKNYMMPTIEISQQWKFLCVPISGIILFIHTLELIFGNLVDMITKSDERTDFYRTIGGHAV
ncbi:MAG: TRAP transporter small permease [Deltaproteobacteria bacterium]|nr:TRAP transporter small permease [Deltaproteobacteria bacterium]MBW2153105.1 TRAP transporter small permease [Deltaproteobacteria bacterium]